MGWVTLLRTQSDEQVLALILGSDEFARRADALFGTQDDPASTVRTLYAFLLGRGAGAGEVGHWVQQLPQLGRAGVALAILTSEEYRERTVSNLYSTVLGRARGPGEGQSHAASGLSLAEITRLFASSDEFIRR